MGAEQAFQWAVSYPDFADRIVATAGTAKAWPHGVVRLEGQIAALTADPAFNGGDYTAPPRKGIEAYGMVWLGWLYSQEWWRKEMWKIAAPDRTLDQELETRRRTFFANNDANDMILQARTWQRHDVGPRRDSTATSSARPALHHRAGAVYAVGDGFVLSDWRRAVRGAVHPRVSLVPISVVVGSSAPARAAIRLIGRFSTKRSPVSGRLQ
jgi:homoserine O-acetyltransferase